MSISTILTTSDGERWALLKKDEELLQLYGPAGIAAHDGWICVVSRTIDTTTWIRTTEIVRIEQTGY